MLAYSMPVLRPNFSLLVKRVKEAWEVIHFARTGAAISDKGVAVSKSVSGVIGQTGDPPQFLQDWPHFSLLFPYHSPEHDGQR